MVFRDISLIGCAFLFSVFTVSPSTKATVIAFRHDGVTKEHPYPENEAVAIRSIVSRLRVAVPIDSTKKGPMIIAPVYTLGTGNDSLAALVAVPIESAAELTPLATAFQVGSLWGVAFDARHQQLYCAAFAKRHVGYGPLGTGGIYRTDWKTLQITPWLDLKALGIPTGIDHHKDLKADPFGQYHDPDFMRDVGTVSLGGMDILNNTLFVANLSDRQVYGIRLPAAPDDTPTAQDIKSYTLPDPGWKGGAIRPFAIKAYKGKIYVGVVCDAADSQSIEDLKAGVYEFDPSSGKFRLLVTLPMGYSRGATSLDWHPWTNDFRKALNPNSPSTAQYPQPILSGIEFGSDDSIVLGFMDRFGHQSGTGQPDPEGISAYSGVAAGDILKVYPARLKYTLEANGLAGKVLSQGAGNRQGPGGGEFFFDDGFIADDQRVVHQETVGGALALLPGSGDILVTAHEPGAIFNNNGVKALGQETGKQTRSWAFYADGQVGTFGKANGIGGIVLASEVPLTTVSGQLWIDTNRNGLRDSEELSGSQQIVELWNQNGGKVESVLSDKNGQYHFASLSANQTYQIRIPEKSYLATLNRAGNDRAMDSDAVQADGYLTIEIQTGSPGTSLNHLDVGLICASKPIVQGQLIRESPKSSVFLLSNFRTDYSYHWAGSDDKAIRMIPLDGRLQLPEISASPELWIQDEKGCASLLNLTALEVEPPSAGDLAVYPNPTTDRAVVSAQVGPSAGMLEVWNLQGQLLLQHSVFPMSDTVLSSVDVRSLAAGSYIIRLQQGVRIRSKVLIKK